MEYKIKNEKVKDLFEVFDDLEKLLTERISDLHKVIKTRILLLQKTAMGS